MSHTTQRLIHWKDEYLIDVYRIDLQHRELFRLASLVMTLEGTSKAVLLEVFKGLVAYIALHFQEEEQLMQDAGYPGLAEHRLLHQTVLRQMEGLVDHAETLEDLQGKLRNVMHSWVTKHVKDADAEMGRFLKPRQPG